MDLTDRIYIHGDFKDVIRKEIVRVFNARQDDFFSWREGLDMRSDVRDKTSPIRNEIVNHTWKRF